MIIIINLLVVEFLFFIHITIIQFTIIQYFRGYNQPKVILVARVQEIIRTLGKKNFPPLGGKNINLSYCLSVTRRQTNGGMS